MSAIESIMMPLSTHAPDFSLMDTMTGKFQTLENLKSDMATVIMFICNHCPYVQHIQQKLIELANTYIPKGISFVAISSNDVATYPEDAPERMREVAQQLGYPFPYLFDESQDVARAYNAACTPEFFVFDKDLKCVYRGQFDDSRPGNNVPVTGDSIRAALNAVLAKKPLIENQKPSIGCNIKWKN